MFLYIFEDGAERQSDQSPTDDDLSSVDGGYLVVIRVQNGIFERVLGDGTWVEIDRLKE